MATSYDASAIETLQTSLLPDHGQSLYQPIDSDNGEICLVELWPGEYDDPISLSLRITKLKDWVTYEEDSYEHDSDEETSDEQVSYEQDLEWQLEYEALSYTWGTKVSPRKGH
jgi:hypothetical protein